MKKNKTGSGAVLVAIGIYLLIPLFFTFLVKIHYAIHDPMVGKGHRWLPQFLYLFDKAFDLASAIEQAVFTMDVQMNKIFWQTKPPPL